MNLAEKYYCRYEVLVNIIVSGNHNLKPLAQLVKSTPKEVIFTLHEFILYPLFRSIKNTELQLQILLDVVQINISALTSHQILLLIPRIDASSEEVKLMICKLIKYTLPDKVLLKAELVTIVLAFISNSRFVELKADAIDALDHLLDIKFIPGITFGVLQLLKNDLEKSVVVVKTINLVTRMFSMLDNEQFKAIEDKFKLIIPLLLSTSCHVNANVLAALLHFCGTFVDRDIRLMEAILLLAGNKNQLVANSSIAMIRNIRIPQSFLSKVFDSLDFELMVPLCHLTETNLYINMNLDKIAQKITRVLSKPSQSHKLRKINEFLKLASSAGIVAEFIDILGTEFEVQSIQSLNELIKHAQPTDSIWIESVIQKYLNIHEEMDESMVVTSAPNNKELIDKRVRNSYKSALIIDGIAHAVKVLNKEQLAYVMMDGLYLILEKLGDVDIDSSNQARDTLIVFARACDGVGMLLETCPLLGFSAMHLKSGNQATAIIDTHDSNSCNSDDKMICNLILQNVDYLVDSVSHKLRYYTLHPMAAKVLTAAVKIVGVDLIMMMDDLIYLVLDILDELGIACDKACDLFYLLSIVLDSILDSRLTNEETLTMIENSTDIDCAHVTGPSVSSEMLSFLGRHKKTEYEDENDKPTASPEEFFRQRNSKMEVLKNNDDIKEDVYGSATLDEAGSKDIIVDEEDDSKLDPHQTLTLIILMRIQYFLASDSPMIRSTTLKIIASGVQIIKGEKVLPFIHLIWNSIMSRCDDKILYVAIEALIVVGVLVKTSPQFMRKRIQSFVTRIITLIESLQSKRPVKHELILTNDLKLRSGSMENKIFMIALQTLEIIVGHTTCKESDLLVIVLLKFLHTSYSNEVHDLSISIICKINSDWLVGCLWLILGGNKFPILNGSVPINIDRPFKNEKFYPKVGLIIDFLCDSETQEQLRAKYVQIFGRLDS